MLCGHYAENNKLFPDFVQDTLFQDLVADAPSTEGIKYTGSKLKLLPHILSLSSKVNVKKVLDGFSGSTRVSQAYTNSQTIWIIIQITL